MHSTSWKWKEERRQWKGVWKGTYYFLSYRHGGDHILRPLTVGAKILQGQNQQAMKYQKQSHYLKTYHKNAYHGINESCIMAFSCIGMLLLHCCTQGDLIHFLWVGFSMNIINAIWHKHPNPSHSSCVQKLYSVIMLQLTNVLLQSQKLHKFVFWFPFQCSGQLQTSTSNTPW